MSPSVKPFNEAKYKALMDGHEIIEIPFKKLTTIIDYRIEPEYFSKRFIWNENLLLGKPYKIFNQIATVNNGRAYSSDSFSSAGEIYISKIGDVTNKREVAAWDKVTKKEFLIQKGSLLSDGDILMTLTGDPPDVGKTNVVITYEKLCTWNQRVAKVERLGDDFISNYALYPVLSSEICRMQMERFAKGIRQRNLGNDCFSFVMVPILGVDLQKILSQIVEKHIIMLKSADNLYFEAETLMLTALNMVAFVPSDKATSIKTFSESFGNVGRLDAEYYQEKYKDIIRNLNISGTISSICKVYDKNFIPDDNSEYKYIELSNVGANGDISDVQVVQGIDLPSRARRIVRRGQIIVSSIEGSLNSCALIDDEFNGALCSTGFYVIDSTKINSESLLVLFKSKPIQALLKQRCSGTILTAISKDEFLNLPLPIIDNEVQKEIADKVQESFRLRNEAKQLLSKAIKAVEMAIKTDEKSALLWLLEEGVDY